MRKLLAFARREAVLCAAALAALASSLFVPPGPQCLGYIDWRVLALLLCLMLVVAGFGRIGAFEALSQRLVRRAPSTRALALVLVLLCFFSAMLITNDVALITFVPLAAATLSLAGQERNLLLVVVLQTIAANLGSALTPFGNPQNLYLYAAFSLDIGAFFAVTLPLAGAGLLLSVLPVLWVERASLRLAFAREARITDKRKLIILIVLSVCCLLAVFRVLPAWAALLLTSGAALAMDRGLFRCADWGLLGTFVCFFIFVGNLKEIGAVREALGSLLAGRETLVAALLSQGISNVPAAVMLAGFTQDWAGLLRGVNIGGLGTPIASLASLISLRLYLRAPGTRMGRYLLVFSALNFAFLGALLLLFH